MAIKKSQNIQSELASIEASSPSKRGFAVRSLKAQADAARTPLERLADWLTTFFGTISFLIINVVVFVFWILANTGSIPGVPIFDPFPFVLLTTTVSLEAIVLAIIVLISQNRAARIGDVREEIDLHINRIAEAEVTQILKLVAAVAKKNGIETDDAEIERMLRPISESKVRHEVEKQTAPKDGPDIDQLAKQIQIPKVEIKK